MNMSDMKVSRDMGIGLGIGAVVGVIASMFLPPAYESIKRRIIMKREAAKAENAILASEI